MSLKSRLSDKLSQQTGTLVEVHKIRVNDPNTRHRGGIAWEVLATVKDGGSTRFFSFDKMSDCTVFGFNVGKDGEVVARNTALEAAIRVPPGPNQLCPCNSGKKYKKCCQQFGDPEPKPLPTPDQEQIKARASLAMLTTIALSIPSNSR